MMNNWLDFIKCGDIDWLNIIFEFLYFFYQVVYRYFFVFDYAHYLQLVDTVANRNQLGCQSEIGN